MQILIALFFLMLFYDGKSHMNDKYIRKQAFRCARRGFR